METGIREFKNNLGWYIRRIEAGERLLLSPMGVWWQSLIPPTAHAHNRISEFHGMIASGAIVPPGEAGDPLENCPKIKLPPGTAAALIDSDRGEK